MVINTPETIGQVVPGSKAGDNRGSGVPASETEDLGDVRAIGVPASKESEGGHRLSDAQQRLKKHLEALVAQPGVVGGVLIRRDGIHVLEVLKKPINRETFAAMSATVMGAAETAASVLGDDKVRRVLVETETFKVVIMGATEDLLLAVVTDPGVRIDQIAPKMETAAVEMANAIR